MNLLIRGLGIGSVITCLLWVLGAPEAYGSTRYRLLYWLCLCLASGVMQMVIDFVRRHVK